ncbi:iron-containing alcohol dehydrogenase [Pseudodesulfovibrio sp.]|uniref:iron-containing alcohol dehydrogenase n=1 Tax=unclassified Pseudodesulfovibrio TaxID=2661612 RepID=UPI003AFF8D94
MLITKFAIPEVIFGNGSIKYLAPCARRLGAKRVLLVSDPGVEKAGWVEVVMDLLRKDALDCVYFNDVNSNPRDVQVCEGAELYKEKGADVIVGIGGGSPIDAAKGISTLVGNGGSISEYEGANKIMRPLPPMIFIPSTAGSGSDVSQFCIITDIKRQVKMSIISRSLVPNLSIIDPNLLVTKSRELIAASAIDAMAHAVESYVSRLASPFTEPQSLRAIQLFMENIREAVDSRSPEALKNLSIASTAAGMAFSNAGLGIAHSLAHSIGGRFDVLHGLVHPVLLPTVMRFNLTAKPEKLARVGLQITGKEYKTQEEQALKGIEYLERLFQELGAARRLNDILPDDSELELLCNKALPDACTLTNPRETNCQDLMNICEAAW